MRPSPRPWRSARTTSTTPSPRWNEVALDVTLVLSLLAWGQAEVWGGGAEVMVGPDWANAATFAFMSLVLLGRRRWPVLVLLAQSLALTALSIASGGTSESLGWLLALAAGLYAVARHRGRGAAIWSAVPVLAMFGLLSAADAADGISSPGADLLGTLPFLGILLGSWLLGRYGRTRQLLAEEQVSSLRLGATLREAELSRRAVEEKQALAADLHDVLAHGLSVMVRQAEAAEARLDRDPVRARTGMQSVATTGRESLAEVRRFTQQLRDSGTEPEPPPGLSALAELLSSVGTAGLAVTLTVSGDLDAVPDRSAAAAYRIVQEALTNALRHGLASEATVVLDEVEHGLRVEVVDNGHGPPTGFEPGGGLAGMKQRVEALGGSVSAGPDGGGGFAVKVRIPGGTP